MSKNTCGSSPSFCASTNASQVATMVAPRIMLLQIFAAWPAPSCAGVDHRLGHRLEERLGALELLVGAADHEGQRAGRGRGDAARHRRVDEIEALAPSSPRRPRARWRRRWSSSRSASVPGLALGATSFSIDRADMLGGGKHGDDDVGVLAPPRRPMPRPCSRPRVACSNRFGDQVERADLMPRLGEVGRHSAAHVAQAR